MPVQIYYYVLSLLSALPAGGGSDDESRYVQPPSVQLPVYTAPPEAIPNVHDRLPEKPSQRWPGWKLSLEGVTRAPVDVGGQAVLELPFRLRILAGYGFVPNAFSGLFTGIAASASSDPQVSSVLNHAR